MKAASLVPAGLALFMLHGVGCTPRGDAHDDEAPGHGEPGAAGSSGAHGGPAEASGVELVRIDPSMLRDLRITTGVVEERAGAELVTLLGELRPDEDHYAEVGTPVAARITRVLVAAGDRVRAGQSLVELESVEIGRARASALGARARVDLARQTLARRTALLDQRIVSAREVEEAQAEVAMAEAELRAASSTSSSVGRRGAGARFVLAAPLDGVVIDRDAVLGRMVDPEHVLFRVGDPAVLWLVAHAFERDAVRVRAGSPAHVSLPALPGVAIDGTVVWIGGRVDSASRTIDVRIEVANPDGTLRPGMSATAAVSLGAGDDPVLVVPAIALQRTADGWCVFVPRGAGAFAIRPVGRGRELGDAVEILSGLVAGERVVVEGAFLLKTEAEAGRVGGDEHGHAH